MNLRSKKLSPEERADELISRFVQHGVSSIAAIYCSLELILEVYYQLITSNDNTHREKYWMQVEEILRNKL
jgi:predicted nucleic-acid-binding protein